MVPLLFSSEIRRMVIAGTKNMKMNGTIPKRLRMEA